MALWLARIEPGSLLPMSDPLTLLEMSIKCKCVIGYMIHLPSESRSRHAACNMDGSCQHHKTRVAGPFSRGIMKLLDLKAASQCQLLQPGTVSGGQQA